MRRDAPESRVMTLTSQPAPRARARCSAYVTQRPTPRAQRRLVALSAARIVVWDRARVDGRHGELGRAASPAPPAPGEQSDADVEAEGRCLESLALTLASGEDPLPATPTPSETSSARS